MTDKERELALFCLRASSDYHSDVCEECIKYPNCDHTIQDDVIETIIEALEQEPKILDTLDFAIDASNGEGNYFVGFRNGLRYAKSLIDGEEEPQFESCTEQEPKAGHWIEGVNGHFNCSECNTDFFAFRDIRAAFIYCPYCSARMIEPQERSDKE